MLTMEIAGLKLKNPTILAAGFLGTSASILKRVADSGAGAVTIKSIGPEPREGNPNPTVLCWGEGLMNAVGLPTPGYKNMTREWAELKDISVPVIASFYGGSISEFVEVAEAIVENKPAMLDVNIGCPNTKKHGAVFGKDPETAGKLINKIKEVAGSIPVMPKLTPNTDNMLEVAKACVDNGADAIAGFNTWGPGMVIDVNVRKPVMGFKTGGISGPAVRPLMVKGIYDLYEKIDAPIVAVGGIMYGTDVIEAMMAGATAVEIGSGIHYRGIDVFSKACSEMEAWMKENGVKSLEELVGSAH
ncbi:MAG: dihydroorotate dehydrogenase [Candidatus Diapherotrites archaeon]|nr:dihydroorotate dehydrogenase [Candidatus Diapherotrites archaeon]